LAQPFRVHLVARDRAAGRLAEWRALRDRRNLAPRVNARPHPFTGTTGDEEVGRRLLPPLAMTRRYQSNDCLGTGRETPKSLGLRSKTSQERLCVGPHCPCGVLAGPTFHAIEMLTLH